MKVQAESFHLNGHIIGFRLQTQKLESPYKTPSNTLAVKGLNQLIYESERLRKFIFKIKLQPFTFWMTILALKLYSLVMFKSEANKKSFL